MTVHEARTHASTQLAQLPWYDEAEAHALARHLLCELLEVKPHALVQHRARVLHEEERLRFEAYLSRLVASEPLQYIVGRAPFLGLELEVNRYTLIPRPETEELVAWIAASHPTLDAVVDVGTGSGCIALSLKEAFPAAAVTGIDISPEAIATAERNARTTGLLARFEVLDVFTADGGRFSSVDVLVANPPYIPEWERHSLNPNVEAWEPPAALFVPTEDPLLFYRRITELACHWLRPGGWLYYEAHATHAHDVRELLINFGFANALLRNDTHGRPRMLRAQKPD